MKVNIQLVLVNSIAGCNLARFYTAVPFESGNISVRPIFFGSSYFFEDKFAAFHTSGNCE